MQMSWPYPLRSPLDPDISPDEKDYNMISPLFADGSNFPCKNYQNTPDSYVTKATYLAGGTYDMWLNGTVPHDGGSCQLSLSYDNGATFKVIKSMIGGCPLTHNYAFTIPSFAPSSDSVLFSWSWFNLIGDREMYQNCARVEIVGGSSTRHRRGSPYRRQVASMDRLPNMFVCNVNNGCQTIERQEVVFPDPGSDVVYGQDAIVPDPGPGFTINGVAASTTSVSLTTSVSTQLDLVTTTGTSSSLEVPTLTTTFTTQTTRPSSTATTTTVETTTVDTITTSMLVSPAAFFTTDSTTLSTLSTTTTPFTSGTGSVVDNLAESTTSFSTLTTTSTTTTPFTSGTGSVVDNLAESTTSFSTLTTTSTSLAPFPLTNGSTITSAIALGTVHDYFDDDYDPDDTYDTYDHDIDDDDDDHNDDYHDARRSCDIFDDYSDDSYDFNDDYHNAIRSCDIFDDYSDDSYDFNDYRNDKHYFYDDNNSKHHTANHFYDIGTGCLYDHEHDHDRYHFSHHSPTALCPRNIHM
ncbi:hypothetical protein AYO20_06008 [Fonsecaea nubica]|uniref:Uncharacterized protein n=1 Tax=Fonsecaea nubica TaxID=856822 RepID=A0A178D0A3_9EURO|nr:hypothetical protein AYO20_06008 [Fonsecaea nubica]OAL34813.1 hypothetical protein AYO20_06008 [Fonsecaea nubica]